MQERLQKIISQAGIASRRAAEQLIAAGRVTVDGRAAVLGEKADPAVPEYRCGWQAAAARGAARLLPAA